jgi:NAD(P)-dependent dehydrogenase (short-subunit alcohol dehydrogenase family)
VLRSQGAHLALLFAPFEASREEEVMQATYGADRERISTYECDITSETSVVNAFEKISSDATSTGVSPSILINAAGYVSVAPLEDISAEEAMKTLTANLLGPFIVSNAFAKLYWAHSESNKQAKKPGRIVSISSQASHVALNGHGAYCASKAGLNGLTRCMANEWGGRGITSNTVSPTVALTALGKKAWGAGQVRDAMLSQIPVGRFAEPDEIAQSIAFIVRDESGMINGADIRIDGGFTIR